MNIDIDDELYIYEYNILKAQFFKKVDSGYRDDAVQQMRDIGISDDSIFISQLIGVYKGCIELGWMYEIKRKTKNLSEQFNKPGKKKN